MNALPALNAVPDMATFLHTLRYLATTGVSLSDELLSLLHLEPAQGMERERVFSTPEKYDPLRTPEKEHMDASPLTPPMSDNEDFAQSQPHRRLFEGVDETAPPAKRRRIEDEENEDEEIDVISPYYHQF